jgi:DNA-binding NarL/FixJ family response regulator
MHRMLIADDDEGMRLLGRMLAEDAGFKVVGEARDGEEAVRLALRLAPEVVLMDRAMPVMDGIEATARIKAARPQTAIVAWTSSDDEAVAESFLSAGARVHLPKGELDQLNAVLAQLGRRAGPERPRPGPAA